MLVLVDRLQLFPRLEAHGFARRNGNFGARPRISSNASLAWTHIEHAKSAQLNPIALRQRTLHALENRFNGEFRLGLRDASFIDHFVNDIELDHGRISSPE